MVTLIFSMKHEVESYENALAFLQTAMSVIGADRLHVIFNSKLRFDNKYIRIYSNFQTLLLLLVFLYLLKRIIIINFPDYFVYYFQFTAILFTVELVEQYMLYRVCQVGWCRIVLLACWPLILDVSTSVDYLLHYNFSQQGLYFCFICIPI